MTPRHPRRQRRAGTRQTTPRHVWLAALGAVAVLRREARAGAESALAAAQRAGCDARRLAGDARDVARGIAMTAEERLQPTLSQARAEVEARIAAVLSRLDATARGAAKPRATARRTSRMRRQRA